MEARTTTQPNPEAPRAPADRVLGRALQPGVVLLGNAREARCADDRALALLGCRDGQELARRWPAIRACIEIEPRPGTTEVELPPAVTGGCQVRGWLVCAERPGGGAHECCALLLQDAELAAALESDLRAASQMRSLVEIAPAVAHDLRAPINAMVLNLEVLKETLAGSSPGRGALAAPAGGRDPRERQQRYVNVLREELSRLHQSLELFLAHISPRGDRPEGLDLREPAQDLAALLRPTARKQQSQIEVLVPDAPVPVLAQRHQLRQALMHLGLVALLRVPRAGTLEIRLDRRASRARLRIIASAPPGEAAGPGGDGARPESGGSSPAPQLEPRFSAAGTEARLEVARGIVAALGGSVRLLPAGARGLPAFEIDFPLSEAN